MSLTVGSIITDGSASFKVCKYAKSDLSNLTLGGGASHYALAPVFVNYTTPTSMRTNIVAPGDGLFYLEVCNAGGWASETFGGLINSSKAFADYFWTDPKNTGGYPDRYTAHVLCSKGDTIIVVHDWTPYTDIIVLRFIYTQGQVPT